MLQNFHRYQFWSNCLSGFQHLRRLVDISPVRTRSVSTMASTKHTSTATLSKRHFSFFELPAELRNMIYAECTRRRRFRRDVDIGEHLVLTNRCIPALRLVSGEFKAEYEAEVHRNAHLDWTVYAWEHLDLQNVASRSAALGLHLLKHLTLTLEYRDLVDTQICEWSPGPALAP